MVPVVPGPPGFVGGTEPPVPKRGMEAPRILPGAVGPRSALSCSERSNDTVCVPVELRVVETFAGSNGSFA